MSGSSRVTINTPPRRAPASTFRSGISKLLKWLLVLLITAQGPLVITNDQGGFVGPRAAYVATLGNREVRIEGTCVSACTMYLAAPNVCVTRDARLGFHGPSFFGADLPPADFDYWSRVLARHYPPAIADWFMTTARYRTFGTYTLTPGPK